MHLYSAVKISIEISKIIKNKNQLVFNDNDIQYLNDCLSIFRIFVKASTKLQTEKYPTIQYIYSYIYQIRVKLEEKFLQLNLVS